MFLCVTLTIFNHFNNLTDMYGVIIITIIIIIIESIFCSRNIVCLWALSASVYRLLRTLVHSTFYLLPWLPIFSSCFLVFLHSCFPEGSKVGQPLVSLHPLNVWLIHLNFLFLICKFIYSCSVTLCMELSNVYFFLSMFYRPIVNLRKTRDMSKHMFFGNK